jgi:hypothetical protein
MHKRIAMIGAALAALATSLPALAAVNPLVAQIVPLGGSAVRGNVTFFQLGPNVNVGLNLATNAGTGALDIRKGTCKAYADSSTMPLGVAQDTRLSNMKLEQLNGSVLLIHKTAQVTSPPIGCAEIKE